MKDIISLFKREQIEDLVTVKSTDDGVITYINPKLNGVPSPIKKQIIALFEEGIRNLKESGAKCRK